VLEAAGGVNVGNHLVVLSAKDRETDGTGDVGRKPEGVVDDQFTPKKAVPFRVLLAYPASVTLQALNARPFKSSHDRLNRFRLVGSWAFLGWLKRKVRQSRHASAPIF
jgi:hypothetical protein